MRTFGTILLIAGITITVLTGFTVISRKDVVSFSSDGTTKKHVTPIIWSPLTGAVLMAGGVVILLLGVKAKPSN